MNELLNVFQRNNDSPAFATNNVVYSYKDLVALVHEWEKRLDLDEVKCNQIVAVCGHFNFNMAALFFCLLNRNAIIVPLSSVERCEYDQYFATAEVACGYDFSTNNEGSFFRLKDKDDSSKPKHQFLRQLVLGNVPGLVLFSSGSTGKSKASVWNMRQFMSNKRTDGKKLKSLMFFQFDHIGGLNTVLSILLNGGELVIAHDRDVNSVCQLIEKWNVELLPTSPTFLNMLVMSDAHKKYDLSSLKIITYGSEPMPNATLIHLKSIFPDVTFKQTYGLTEIGILSTKSESPTSTWIKLDEINIKKKIIDNILWVKTPSSMLGYLNAPTPFEQDGWLNTHDIVEVNGDYIRILGRDSEIINVGGEKVYPTEVENVLLQMECISDVCVMGKKNPIIGQIVFAKVLLAEPIPLSELENQIRQFCVTRLEPYKIPLLIEITNEPLSGARNKKIRK